MIHPSTLLPGGTIGLSSRGATAGGTVRKTEYAHGGLWYIWTKEHSEPFSSGPPGLWEVTSFEPAEIPQIGGEPVTYWYKYAMELQGEVSRLHRRWQMADSMARDANRRGLRLQTALDTVRKKLSEAVAERRTDGTRRQDSALSKILAIHSPYSCSEGCCTWCSECDEVYPCSTREEANKEKDMSDRLEQISADLDHLPCCDHLVANPNGCSDCGNLGCAHAPYLGSTKSEEDLKDLLEFARSVDVLAYQGDQGYLEDDAFHRELRKALQKLTGSESR